MAEHSALVDQADGVRHELGAGDSSGAMALLTGLVANLDRHVKREEDGIFRAMRNSGEFLDEVDELEGEHRDFAAVIASLGPTPNRRVSSSITDNTGLDQPGSGL